MTIETVSESKAFGGVQGVYRHASAATGADMAFSVFVPDHPPGARLSVLWYLSGLTCTHANVTEKGEYRRACAEHGMRIGLDGVQLLGGHGFVKEHPVERWYRDLRAVGVMEGAVLV